MTRLFALALVGFVAGFLLGPVVFDEAALPGVLPHLIAGGVGAVLLVGVDVIRSRRGP